MSGVIRTVQEFSLNGWTIRPCHDDGSGGFDLVHGDERYHYDSLEPAVAGAQASSRQSSMISFCDVPHHTHTDGGGRLPTCRLDSPE
jgi:hypothetical protein